MTDLSGFPSRPLLRMPPPATHLVLEQTPVPLGGFDVKHARFIEDKTEAVGRMGEQTELHLEKTCQGVQEVRARTDRQAK